MYVYELTPEEITLETIDGVQCVNGVPVDATPETDCTFVDVRAIQPTARSKQP